ncbi:hypothetical protein V1Y59_03900 [Gordonia sp. PKS22-38]|uniref:Uncharacterized protein n=1 Tax=Gordonia prachuapensis TaxID=3115651 RepID=A0ABU7MPH4_9ACTN|nr:hypothetical protein [Gordonia sp. PKS22-38]
MPHDETIAPDSALARLAESGRLAEVVDVASPVRAELDAAARRYTRPLHVRVSGRPGSGRDTCVRALGARLAVSAARDGASDDDADLWVHVLTGPARQADRDVLDTLPTDRTLVLLGKSDTHRDRQVADAVAAECAEGIGRPVHPVSALLACADVTEAELDLLRRMSATGETVPVMSGGFLAAGGDDERSTRTSLLRGLDRAGIGIALDLLAREPGGTDPADNDPAEINRELWARSGFDDLIPAIRGCMEPVRQWRLIELRARLEGVAARGPDRDAVEHLLQQAYRPATEVA